MALAANIVRRKSFGKKTTRKALDDYCALQFKAKAIRCDITETDDRWVVETEFVRIPPKPPAGTDG